MLKNESVSLIARALLKYGYSNFQLEILEYCKPLNCIEREQYFIDLFQNVVIFITILFNIFFITIINSNFTYYFLVESPEFED